ncbi:MAG: cell filamentation protein Fic [Pelobacteraceae bacterium]
MTTPDNSVVLYQSPDGKTALDVHLDHDTVWLNQAQLVSLFNRDQSVISRHLRNVFTEGELDEKSNMQKMHFANSDKPVVLYNLDVIISVGYRVALVALTLLIAESRPDEKDTIVKVIVNLINRNND